MTTKVPRLYKYLPCNEYTYRSLAIPAFWCGSAIDTNDPFESLLSHTPSYTEQELAYFRDNFSPVKSNSKTYDPEVWSRSSKEEIQRHVEAYWNKLIQEFAFCALSEDPLNTLMWSHYANNHSGCVIGIDFPDDFNGNLKKVQYLNKPPHMCIEYFTDFHSGKTNDIDPLLTNLSAKTPDWGYEKEWRIWRKSKCYLGLREYKISEVIFGLRTSTDTKRVICNLLNGTNAFNYTELEAEYDPPRLKR